MSYADMITILMAFFVVMYSMAGTRDEVKEQAVMKSLRHQFGAVLPGIPTLGPGGFINVNSPLASLSPSGDSKRRAKGNRGTPGRQSQGDHPRVHTLKPGQQAAVGGVIVFPEGSIAIEAEQRKQLQIAAEELGGKPQKIEIRGHTSGRPVPRGSQFRDHWDLAYARCHVAMQQLVKLGIDPKRIRLGVAADNEPLLPDGDVAARTQTSRVEIFMLNEVVADESRAEPPSVKRAHAPANTTPTNTLKEPHHG